MDNNNRRGERCVVDVPVTLVTVLDSIEATIADLTGHGAMITGAALPKGMKFQIEYMGQTLYAQCMWSEVDRMGVRFQFDLMGGPLYDILALAMHDGDDGQPANAAPSMMGSRPFATTPFLRPAPATFGKRSLQ